MKLIKKTLILASVFCSAIFSSLALADVAVIVNSANGSAISDKDISRIFLGKTKKFASGDAATPVNLKFGEATRVEFDEKALGKSSSQIKGYWSKRVFSGKGNPPEELASDADVIKFVSSTPGAIGYVSSANADGSVKVVKTF